LDAQTNAWAVDLIFLHITAQAAEQTAYNTKGGSEQDYVAEVARQFAELPQDRYPMIVGMREQMLGGGGDARQVWALRALINGILATPVE
jgi:hypothetical protein